jgi:hypothetical protein
MFGHLSQGNQPARSRWQGFRTAAQQQEVVVLAYRQADLLRQ